MSVSEGYQNMDQQTIDAAYNNSAAVTDSAARVAAWEARGHQTRARPNARLNIAYGPLPRNRFDYFAADQENAPLFVFVHGGYWQRNSKETFSFISEGPNELGINVAVIGYTLAPDASLSQIVDEVELALDTIHASSAALGFDPSHMYVGGWSAGGHLAALAAKHPAIKGVLSISGIFDLAPIAKTYINEKLRLTPTEIEQLGPLQHIEEKRIPYLIYVGGEELSELQRQSAEYAVALKKSNLNVDNIVATGLNHFTIVDELASADGILARGLKKMVDLK